MSRKHHSHLDNFLRDNSFSNISGAIASSIPVTQQTYIPKTSTPIAKPTPTLAPVSTYSAPAPTSTTTTVSPTGTTSVKPTITSAITSTIPQTTQTYSAPIPNGSTTPVLAPVVTAPIVPVLALVPVTDLATGGGGGGGGGGFADDSSKKTATVMKKSWIPLLLVGVAIFVFIKKPLTNK